MFFGKVQEAANTDQEFRSQEIALYLAMVAAKMDEVVCENKRLFGTLTMGNEMLMTLSGIRHIQTFVKAREKLIEMKMIEIATQGRKGVGFTTYRIRLQGNPTPKEKESARRKRQEKQSRQSAKNSSLKLICQGAKNSTYIRKRIPYGNTLRKQENAVFAFGRNRISLNPQKPGIHHEKSNQISTGLL